MKNYMDLWNLGYGEGRSLGPVPNNSSRLVYEGYYAGKARTLEIAAQDPDSPEAETVRLWKLPSV